LGIVLFGWVRQGKCRIRLWCLVPPFTSLQQKIVKMKNKVKKINDTKFYIKKIVDRYTDEFGRKRIIVQWEEVETGEVNLGSLANPNENIVSIKWRIPSGRRWFDI
jgi:hypothetical protein